MHGRHAFLFALVILVTAPATAFAQNTEETAKGDDFTSFARRLADGEKPIVFSSIPDETDGAPSDDIEIGSAVDEQPLKDVESEKSSLIADKSQEPIAESALIPPPSTGVARSGDSKGGVKSSSLSLSGNDWILKTLTALGIVLALIFILRWLWMKMTGQVSATSNTEVVEVLSRTTIAPKNHVVLLRIAGRVLVCNDSGQGMTTLATIDDPQEIAAILAQVSAAKSNSMSRSFTDLMQRFNGDYETEQVSEEGGDEEYAVDNTRNQLSGLLSRLRTAGADS